MAQRLKAEQLRGELEVRTAGGPLTRALRGLFFRKHGRVRPGEAAEKKGGKLTPLFQRAPRGAGGWVVCRVCQA